MSIDVAGQQVDVAMIGAELPASFARVLDDAADGHGEWVDGSACLAPVVVPMEATGGCEAAFA